MPTRHLPPALARLIRIVTWIENGLLIALLALMVSLAGAQILLRNLFDMSILDVDQLLRLLVLWGRLKPDAKKHCGEVPGLGFLYYYVL